MNHFYQEIEGWFSFPELYKEVVGHFDNGIFVEIGSWKGASSSHMAVEIINQKKNISFFCVDTWEGSIENQDSSSVINNTLYNEFKDNMSPVEGYYTSIRKPSLMAATHFEDSSIDFIFIDASHQYADVIADIKAWLPKLKTGGIIAGHDIDLADVKRAVDEVFGLENITEQENCWVFNQWMID